MKAKTIFGISQDLLYKVCTLAWQLCQQYLAQFTAFKGFYRQTLIDAALANITSAKNLPTTSQTTVARKNARVNLQAQAKLVRQLWQNLKSYIGKAYPKAIAKNQLEAAGSAFYKKGSNDWVAIQGLIDAANTFIADNINQLTENDNMPPVFKADFQVQADTFQSLATIFSNADTTKQLAVKTKQDANNAIYESTMEMLKDAQQIFLNNEALKSQFTFAHIVASNQGGVASFKGYITDENGMAIPGVSIGSTDGKYEAATDAKGYFRISRIAANVEYTFVIAKIGYLTFQHNETFQPGTSKTVTLKLAIAMQAAA